MEKTHGYMHVFVLHVKKGFSNHIKAQKRASCAHWGGPPPRPPALAGVGGGGAGGGGGGGGGAGAGGRLGGGGGGYTHIPQRNMSFESYIVASLPSLCTGI